MKNLRNKRDQTRKKETVRERVKRKMFKQSPLTKTTNGMGSKIRARAMLIQRRQMHGK